MLTRTKHARDAETDGRRCRQRVEANQPDCKSMPVDIGKKRARVSRMCDTATREYEPDERMCVYSSFVRLGKRGGDFTEVGPAKFVKAGTVVLRFMRKFSNATQTSYALALNTLPPSPTGVTTQQAIICGHQVFIRRILCHRTNRAMSRFVRHTGLLQGMNSISTHPSVFVSYLLRCFDICGNPRFYGGHGPYGGSVSIATTAELIQVARILEATFTDARQRVLSGGSGCGEVVQMALCVQLQQFEVVWRTWRHEHSGGIQKCVQMVLFNLYDTGVILRKGLEAEMVCCVRKPFLHEEARRYIEQAIVIEKKFLRVSVTLSAGHIQLREMKRVYRELRGCDIFEDYSTMAVKLPTTCYNKRSHREKVSHREMQRIMCDIRSSDRYSMEEIHHETVLDMSFHVKYAHLHRDDACLLEASRFYEKGKEHSLRVQMQDMQTGGLVYRHALLAIKHAREHLVALDVHTDFDVLSEFLDEMQLKKRLDNGSMSWRKVLRTLHTIVHGMQFCVGTEISRTILYQRRLRRAVATRTAGRVSSATSMGSHCHGPNTHGVNKTRKKLHDISHVSQEHILYTDSPLYAMDQETYESLKNRLKNLKNADLSHSTTELGGLFCETLLCITEEMRNLDVSLTNADIYATRLCSVSHNIKVEQKSFNNWFAHGLHTYNTIRWLRGSTVCGSGVSVVKLVFDGYLSLIMGKASQQLHEMDYPELVVLDIAYIQKARGMFYGQVAQATILVIIGQRLTDLGVSGTDIKQSLYCVATTRGFVDFGRPETCRGDKHIQDSLQKVLRGCLNRLLTTNTMRNRCDIIQACEGILSEVARETCHYGYPCSLVASNIARRWNVATSKAVSNIPGVSDMFASPEATRVAFTEYLLIPKAAVCLSRDFHFNVLEIVKRVEFNVSVHSGRYRELVQKL
jgi:hypothetical protein